MSKNSFIQQCLCQTLFYVLTIITEDKPNQHLHEVKFYTNKKTKKQRKHTANISNSGEQVL